MKSWTDEELILACSEVYSMRALLVKLGLKPAGGNYKSINKHIQRLEIDTSHWKGQAWAKGEQVTLRKSAPLDKVLVVGSNYKTSRLRKRLIKERVLDNVCSECGISETYNNKPITLHLDHINGKNNDNRIENLRLLCPNCHSQTETYCGYNNKSVLFR